MRRILALILSITGAIAIQASPAIPQNTALAGNFKSVTSIGTTPLPPTTQLQRDIAYGKDPLQKIDVYRSANATSAPIIMMVHGGAWMRGDKRASNVIQNKIAHWLPKGYIFISVNYRLAPEANPIEQARDIAGALAYVQANAPTWGGDPNHIILMGHSSGAHLVSLLTADPSIAKSENAKPWLATISLDSAAYNIEQIMALPHFGFYDTVFKSDRKFWRAASPTLMLESKPVPMLLVCSTKRILSCPQAQAFGSKAASFGGHVTQLPVDMTHEEINELLGSTGSYTSKVDEFIHSLGLP